MGRTDGEDMLGPTLGVRLELFPDARPAQRRDRHSVAPRAIGCAGADKEHSQQLVVEAPLCLQWVVGLSLGLMDMLPGHPLSPGVNGYPPKNHTETRDKGAPKRAVSKVGLFRSLDELDVR